MAATVVKAGRQMLYIFSFSLKKFMLNLKKMRFNLKQLHFNFFQFEKHEIIFEIAKMQIEKDRIHF